MKFLKIFFIFLFFQIIANITYAETNVAFIDMQYNGNHYKVVCVLPAYNAENDLSQSADDGIDVLRNAPLVSVDMEDNVSLRGSTNIKF